MKRNWQLLVSALFAILINGVISCSSNKDITIKADLATKAKEEKDFAGVRFTVENGTVTLNGECATEKSRSTVESTAKGLYAVKDVVNNITIGPVVIGTDQLLKQSVDSVLQQYPAMEAVTKDSVVNLQGKITDDKLGELKKAIESLKPKMVNALAISK